MILRRSASPSSSHATGQDDIPSSDFLVQFSASAAIPSEVAAKSKMALLFSEFEVGHRRSHLATFSEQMGPDFPDIKGKPVMMFTKRTRDFQARCFLRVSSRGQVRFVYASYVTKKVEDEPADAALPIVQSRNRMVGKILQPAMLRAWLQRRRIEVLGHR